MGHFGILRGHPIVLTFTVITSVHSYCFVFYTYSVFLKKIRNTCFVDHNYMVHQITLETSVVLLGALVHSDSHHMSQCISCCYSCYSCSIHFVQLLMLLQFCWSFGWLSHFPTSSWHTLLFSVCSNYIQGTLMYHVFDPWCVYISSSIRFFITSFLSNYA